MIKTTSKLIGNLINGEWIHSNETFEVLNKCTQEVIATVAHADESTVKEAVKAAREAFETNPLTVLKRYEILMNAASIIEKRKEEISLAICREVGKPIKEARQEVERGIQTFIASAEEGKRIVGEGMPIESQPGNDGKMSFSIRVPKGVVCAITPFNFPFNLTAHKIAPAIAAGNTVVLKPAQATPISAALIGEVLMEAGLPAGYLNIVNGKGSKLGDLLVKNPSIDFYTFTGSPEVGRFLKNNTGIRHVVLELGSNSPNIIHSDVKDLEEAMNLCIRRGFSNAGQACISVQRLYVQQDLYERALEISKNIVSTINIGNPEVEETDIGPMINEQEAVRTEKWVHEAVFEGATIVAGGRRNGAFFEPTVLANVTSNMKVMCEEVFAPVISIIPYETIEEAIAFANDSKYGLQAGIFTENLRVAMEAAKKLQFGGVNINEVSTYRVDILPYGGVKDSGLGKEGPKYVIEEMTDLKLINIHV
ncbi:acyl-CoA reductase-like NAD-dependent aldehyde dehydrogenase [Lysinibacillus composti]|uniref:Aldehyde dehydrogenase family protein n=1 Tax=Lysinibacillus composti TaxID=720633 RepID=A0A3N9UIN4_9BACI|nr:aldehyde dehydrogenase family protein [Lysinibacillus composti]MBM7607653.1 acyl-CoA reductase-like NAD-dependent aldehyde dehydrogenase [Lysinibacillus composti]RQW75845.1 aldehyde dehydrogenase family protein [Lysinibacillus composti]